MSPRPSRNDYVAKTIHLTEQNFEIARALDAGRRRDANALAAHALAIAVGFGLLFMLAVLGSGRWLYSAMGGSGASLTAALTYSTVVFSGAILIWVFNSIASDY